MSECLKTPLYGNCVILAPDGQQLCRTDQKKLDWYLSRDLADNVEGAEFPTIRLRFEPSGRCGANHPYSISCKENRCVCCGSEEYISRHHVVPYCFRKHFPEKNKAHTTHDVLPLCLICHKKYEDYAWERKVELAKQYNVPTNNKQVFDRQLICVRGAAVALHNHCDKIPAERKELLLDKLRKYYDKNDITREDIHNIIKIRLKNSGGVSFYEVIVGLIDDIQDFIIGWRKHFVEKMQPQHMPAYWDINHIIKDC